MEEERKIKQTLSKFPSSFDVLNDVHTSSRKRQMTTLEKLIRELDECSLEIDIETTRAWNLISFLCFLVGDKENAVYYNRRVKEKDFGNIIATTNRALFYYDDKDFYECNEICQTLEKDQQSKLQMLKAKAEIAYTYSRLGVHVYKIAEERYVNVLQESNDIGSVPMEYICVWKFGLALILSRHFNVRNWYSGTDNDIDKQKARSLLLLYQEISLMTGETLCKYRARANIEIGLFVNNIERYEALFSIDIFSENRSEYQHESSEYYIKLANEICPDDVFVLERSGKYYRYQAKLDLSIANLRKALSIRETSFGHHHLALSLIQQAKYPRTKNSGKQHIDELGLKTNKPAINVEYKRENKLVHSKAESDNVLYEAEQNVSTKGLKRSFSNMKVTNMTCSDSDSPCIGISKTSTTFNPTPTTFASIPERKDTELRTHKIVKHTYLMKNRETSFLTSGSSSETAENDESKWKTVVKRKQRRFSHTGGDLLNRQIHGIDMHKITLPECKYASVELGKTYYGSIAMVKSPRSLPTLLDNSRNREIFGHERAYEISKFNTSALYDKGLMLRRIHQPKEALCIFKQLMKEECPIIQLSNTYEQAAFCLMDIEHSEKDKTDYSVKLYLNKSIETSCNIVSSLPSLKDCWYSVPTLKSLISGQTETKHTLKELCHLNERLGNHREAIGLYEKIANLETDEDEKAEVLMKIVNSYVKDQKFDEAGMTCELIMCLPNGIKKIDQEVYCKVHVHSGIDALLKGETEISLLRFQNALYFGKRLGQSLTCSDQSSEANKNTLPDGDMDQEFDIFILCDQNEDEKGRKVKSDLELTGLKVTINSDAVTYGHAEMSGIERVMKHSKHFVVVVCGECETQITDFEEMLYLGLRNIQKEKSHKNSVVVLDEPGSKVSSMLAMKPQISMSSNNTLNHKQRMWLNDLLLMLATGKQIKTHGEATEA